MLLCFQQSIRLSDLFSDSECGISLRGFSVARPPTHNSIQNESLRFEFLRISKQNKYNSSLLERISIKARFFLQGPRARSQNRALHISTDIKYKIQALATKDDQATTIRNFSLRVIFPPSSSWLHKLTFQELSKPKREK